MNALWVLHQVALPELAAHLARALASPNELLRAYAAKIQRGEVDG